MTESTMAAPAENRTQTTTDLLTITDLAVAINAPQGIVRAVRNATIRLSDGQIHGLVGESGSGKSMTAKSVLRLNNEAATLYGGSVTFDGTDLLELRPRQMIDYRRKRIALISQDPVASLDPLQTVGAQIGQKLRLAAKDAYRSAKQREKRVEELLESVGIRPAKERIKQYPFQMSGGMLQRVNIAMALAGEPDLLIADEPTTALDVTVQMQILLLLKRLQRQFHMAILIITHNFGVVAEICDSVSVMYHGVTVEQGDVDSIFRSPQHPYTRGLMAAIPKSGSDQGLPEPITVTFDDPLTPELSEPVEGSSWRRRPITVNASSTHSYAITEPSDNLHEGNNGGIERSSSGGRS